MYLDYLEEKRAEIGRAIIIVDYLAIDEDLENEALNALEQLRDKIDKLKDEVMREQEDNTRNDIGDYWKNGGYK